MAPVTNRWWRIGCAAFAFGLAARLAHAAPLAITDDVSAIYLVAGDALVDMDGLPSSNPVGTATAAVDWSPLNGHLFACGGTKIWEHDGTEWTEFADLSSFGLLADTSSDLAISPTGVLAFVDSQDRIFLLDPSGTLVDMSGAPTSSHVGTAPAIEWNPVNGRLFAYGGPTVWEHDGDSWTVFADLTSYGIVSDTSSDLAIDSTGLIALVDSTDKIYLVGESGTLVDIAGAPSSTWVGSAPAAAYDPENDHLFAWGGSRVWENDGGGWNVVADLSDDGVVGDTSSRIAFAVPEPTATPLQCLALATLALVRARRSHSLPRARRRSA